MIEDNNWVSVKDRLPEFTEDSYWYNDQNIREVRCKNDHATVLAYDPKLGIIIAEYSKHGWREIASRLSNSCVTITHWKLLPHKPE